VRETAALSLDSTVGGPPLVLQHGDDRTAATLLQVLTTRVRLLTAGRVLDGIALDKYVLLRDAYLSRRRSQVYDGNPPEDNNPEPAPDQTKPATGPKRNP
jgi:phospholipid-binding lipoprotein MlaA